MSGMDWVTENYTAALGHVHSAACLIEETDSAMTDAVSRQARVRLVVALNAVYAELSRVLGMIREQGR